MDLIDLASWALLMSGAFFCVVGGIGLHRLPDFFSRMHGAGVTDTLGAGLVLGGLMLQAGWTLVLVKLVFVLALLWITSPTAAHAIARAALEDGLEPYTTESEEPPAGREGAPS
ncbi:MAG: monovalent cation/H(+) antiporter subunit G [Gemmatimonadaceae bacterium]|nr:monovalent cation/H(+) antiporter subunit G [Gemmatimonadaceae bacterium]